jgi:hypothetical protein
LNQGCQSNLIHEITFALSSQGYDVVGIYNENYTRIYSAVRILNEVLAYLWDVKSDNDGYYLEGGCETTMLAKFVHEFKKPSEGLMQMLTTAKHSQWRDVVEKELLQQHIYKIGAILKLDPQYKMLLVEKDLELIILGNGQGLTAYSMTGYEFRLPKLTRNLYSTSSDLIKIEKPSQTSTTLFMSATSSSTTKKITVLKGQLSGSKDTLIGIVHVDRNDSLPSYESAIGVVFGLKNIDTAIDIAEEHNKRIGEVGAASLYLTGPIFNSLPILVDVASREYAKK